MRCSTNANHTMPFPYLAKSQQLKYLLTPSGEVVEKCELERSLADQLICINLLTIFQMFAENLILVLGSYALKLPKGYKVGVGNIFRSLDLGIIYFPESLPCSPNAPIIYNMNRIVWGVTQEGISSEKECWSVVSQSRIKVIKSQCERLWPQ